PEPAAADHPAVRIDHRARVVGRPHAAGAAGMLGVGALGEHPVVELLGREGLVDRPAGHAVLDAAGDGADLLGPADLTEPMHAVAHAHQVAVVAQHALIDARVDRGITGGDAHAAFAQRL